MAMDCFWWLCISGQLLSYLIAVEYTKFASDTLSSMSGECVKGNLDTPSALLCLTVGLNS